MIDKAKAIEVQTLALEAITALTEALNVAVASASPETLELIRRGVGLSIGTIDTEMLSVLRRLYPDIDHLK
jgi:hypothetical protein